MTLVNDNPKSTLMTEVNIGKPWIHFQTYVDRPMGRLWRAERAKVSPDADYEDLYAQMYAPFEAHARQKLQGTTEENMQTVAHGAARLAAAVTDYDRCGRPNFCIGPTLYGLLAHTKLDLDATSIKMPYQTFWLNILGGGPTYIGADGRQTAVFGLYCSTASFDGGMGVLVHVFDVRPDHAAVMSEVSGPVLNMFFRPGQTIDQTIDRCCAEQGLSETSRQNFRSIMGFLSAFSLYMRSDAVESSRELIGPDPSAEIRRIERNPNIKKQEKQKRLQDIRRRAYYVVWLGRTLERLGPGPVTGMTDESGPRRTHVVRGHFRRLVHPTPEREFTWVRPHVRGQDDAERLTARLYRFVVDRQGAPNV